jgi:hypothetical protein
VNALIDADLERHPAASIDEAACAATVHAWLLGRGPMWDPFMRDHRPDMCDPEQTLDYTLDGVLEDAIEEGLVDDGRERLKASDPETDALLMRWCLDRARICAATLADLEIVDGHVLAHRLVAATPATLRASLGIFWTHSIDECVDPYPMWSERGRDEPDVLLVAAMVPAAAIDWNVSCMALMDWLIGDSEQELRVLPGWKVRIANCVRWNDEPHPGEEPEPVLLPDLHWTT